jgi:ABC-type dipeptide/oligopeptide/nickel transport system permease subunit
LHALVIVRVTTRHGGHHRDGRGLGFLASAPSDTSQWGAMIADGRSFLIDHWWVAAMPACLWWSRSGSTSSATGCATCSTPGPS